VVPTVWRGLLSGFVLDPHGVQMRPATWRVSDEFNKTFVTGDAYAPQPPRQFMEFDLTSPTPNWPRAYIINVILAEEDHGGFAALLHKIWAKVGDDVSKKAGDAAGKGMNAGDYAVYIAQVRRASCRAPLLDRIGLIIELALSQARSECSR
jgi:hypothetical protein